MVTIMLICTRCNQEKDKSQFYKNKRYASGYMTWCKECHYDYYHKDKSKLEKLKNAIHKWAQLNKKHVSDNGKRWYQENKESKRERDNKRFRERYANDQEFRKHKNDYKSHFNHKRRAQMESESATLTQEQWDFLCVKYNYRCLCCREKKPLTIDHIVPLSKGGTHSIDNVQPLCKSCNSKKMTKTIDYRINWE